MNGKLGNLVLVFMYLRAKGLSARCLQGDELGKFDWQVGWGGWVDLGSLVVGRALLGLGEGV